MDKDSRHVLFQKVDLTELDKVQADRAETLGRIDAGLKTVMASIDSFNQAKVPTPDSIYQFSFTPADCAAIAAEPAEAVAGGVTTAVEQVIQLRQEVEAGEQLILTRRHEVEAAVAAREASTKQAIRNTLRVGAFMLFVALLRWCTS